jgi:hypothetical protein
MCMQEGENGSATPAEAAQQAPPPQTPHKHSFLSDLRVYCRQRVLLPLLAMACLYCTVLSLGFLMTSYLQWCGLTSAEVGGVVCVCEFFASMRDV